VPDGPAATPAPRPAAGLSRVAGRTGTRRPRTPAPDVTMS